MKIRGLLIASLIFLVLAGLLYYSNHHKPADESAKASADSPSILKLDESTITKLDTKKKDSPEIVLAKNGSGNWQIIDPKPLGADQATVNSALSTLSSLNSERVVEDKASDLKRYGLDQPALEVNVTEKDNKTQKLLIGDDTPAGGAVYASIAGDPRVFTIASYNKTSIDKSLNDWRDKRLLTVNSDKVSRIELDRKNEAIELGRNKEDWQILKPKPLRADGMVVSELLRKLTDARMDLSAADANKEADAAFAHGTPVAAVKVTDSSGTQELEIRKSKDTNYAKSSVVEGVYKVSADLGTALDKGVDDFRNKKLFDFGYEDPNKVETHTGTKAYFLLRNGDDWWSNGKKMDADSVQAFISKLRDLSASKFVDSGFNSPATMEITIASQDGKRAEKIQISKSANNYIAQRENEPGLYQIDSSAVDDLQKAADDMKPVESPKK